MRAMVLGGTRFIGRALVDELVDAGHEVLVVHRGNWEPNGLADTPHLHVARADLASKRTEIEAFAPDVVIDTIQISRETARATLDAVPGDHRWLVLSSIDVYRAYGALHRETESDAVPFDETDPVRTGDARYPYRGQVPGMDDYEKLDVEEEFNARGGTVCRLPMVYGPHDYQRREGFILRRVVAGRTRIPFGNGMWLGTRGFVGDIAVGLRLAAERDDIAGEIFNLGERRTPSMAMWARAILAAAGHEAELVRVPDDELPEDLGTSGTVSQHLLADSSKARHTLGWTDRPADEALKISVDWHLANVPDDWADGDFSADDEALARATA